MLYACLYIIILLYKYNVTYIYVVSCMRSIQYVYMIQVYLILIRNRHE